MEFLGEGQMQFPRHAARWGLSVMGVWRAINMALLTELISTVRFWTGFGRHWTAHWTGLTSISINVYSPLDGWTAPAPPEPPPPVRAPFP
jgi:hypothetical protein